MESDIMAERTEESALTKKLPLPGRRKIREKKIMVQGTNDNSILSKYSMASVGYFDDEFLQFFVQKNIRRSPLINRGYYIRAKVMEFVIEKFLAEFCDRSMQIVSLGAGFDSTFFRLTNQGLLKQVKYIEVDLPNVVRRKTQMIESNEELCTLVGSFDKRKNGIVSASYALINCDIEEISEMEKLCKMVDLQQSVPTLVMSEVVLAYIQNDSASKLIHWVGDYFTSSVFVLYEQIHPEDPFGQIMQMHFKAMQSPLQCITLYPNIDSQIKRFKQMGWPIVTAVDMNEFFQDYVSDKEKSYIERLEPFDEFEEWHLKCAHYTAVTAFTGICQRLQPKIFQVKHRMNGEKSVQDSNQTWSCVMDTSSCLERYGHRLTTLANDLILITGGFGINVSRHERLSDGVLIHYRAGRRNDIHLLSLSVFEGPRMFHSATLLRNGFIFIFGGRAAPSKPCIDVCILRYEIPAREPEDGVDVLDTFCFVTHWSGTLFSTNKQNHEEETKRWKPCPRWRHTATSVNIQGEECVLIFGGRDDKVLAFADIWIFNVRSFSWKKAFISCDALKARCSHAASIWQDRLIITGGIDETLQPLNLFQILDYCSFPMKLETKIFKESLPARYSHSQHVIRDNLWIVGGISLNLSSSLIVVNLDMFTWTECSLAESASQSNPVMLHNHTSVILEEKELLIVGGGGNCFSFGTHFNKGLSFKSLPTSII